MEFLPGFHYSNTLRNWKERFLLKKGEIIKIYELIKTSKYIKCIELNNETQYINEWYNYEINEMNELHE